MPNLEVQSRPSGSALTLPANGAETVVLTSDLLYFNNPTGSGNYIEGTIYLTPGTSSTTATVRCRQDTLTGALVDATPALTVVAAAPIAISFSFQDGSARSVNTKGTHAGNPIDPDPGIKYVITVQTNSTVAGSAYGSCSIQAGNPAS